MEAIGSREAEEGPGAKPGSWEATTGTCGAESEGLATGLLLTLSPVPSFGDSLSETSLLIKAFPLHLPCYLHGGKKQNHKWQGAGWGREDFLTGPPQYYLLVEIPVTVQRLSLH